MEQDQALFLIKFFAPEIEQELQTTKKVINAIPVDKLDYKPDSKSKSAFELAWHIASSDVWFIDAIAKGDFNYTEQPIPAEIKTPHDISSWYDKNLINALNKVKALTAEAAIKPINFFNIANLPAVVYLGWMIKHSVHHRGQLSTYLRPMGSKVPSIYGGSADEPFGG